MGCVVVTEIIYYFILDTRSLGLKNFRGGEVPEKFGQGVGNSPYQKHLRNLQLTSANHALSK